MAGGGNYSTALGGTSLSGPTVDQATYQSSVTTTITVLPTPPTTVTSDQGLTEGQLLSGTLAGVLFICGIGVALCVLPSGPAAPFVAATAVGLFAAGIDTALYTYDAGPNASIQGAGAAAENGFSEAAHYLFDWFVP